MNGYVLAGLETKTVGVFRRDQAGVWVFMPYGEDDEVEQISVGIAIPVNAIYEDVVLDLPETQLE